MTGPSLDHLPLFPAQVIGSLPRPQLVRDVLQQRQTFPQQEYVARLDDCVRFAIQLQQQAGLDIISDGEWRRTQYIHEFLSRAGGFRRCRRYQHQGQSKLGLVVVERMKTAAPVFIEDAQFLVDNAQAVTKATLPSPFLIAVRYWHQEYSSSAYPTCAHFLEHLAEILAREAQALETTGIQIVQLDDPALAYFCDRRLTSGQTIHDERLQRDWNIERELKYAIDAINCVCAGLGIETHLHCCHSVSKRHSDVQGNYQPILSRLAALQVDQLNLEFAYPDTGDVEDLKYVPEHFRVGMGVVDVRRERLPSVAEITTLARRGLAHLAPERIFLNPDCGFAPDAGEPPTLDEAYTKLCRLVEAARQLRAESAP
ncbi:MAG: cobalamin-independent methionine synthase II family protein [Planctomycetota bacterium]|nr:cobalamin-independent methionine synthase II family protein [Planctomycetota bacterium]